MLNRSLCRQAGSFVSSLVTMDRQGTRGASLCPEPVMRQWPSQYYCPHSARHHKGKPKRKRKDFYRSCTYCSLTPTVHLKSAYTFIPLLFCHWNSASIPLTASKSLCSNVKDASSLQTGAWSSNWLTSLIKILHIIKERDTQMSPLNTATRAMFLFQKLMVCFQLHRHWGFKDGSVGWI